MDERYAEYRTRRSPLEQLPPTAPREVLGCDRDGEGTPSASWNTHGLELGLVARLCGLFLNKSAFVFVVGVDLTDGLWRRPCCHACPVLSCGVVQEHRPDAPGYRPGWARDSGVDSLGELGVPGG